MDLPTTVEWPASAVTFILVGGEDYFRGNFTPEQYLVETKSHVPPSNGTTAILYVNEMQHMPQAALFRAVLPHMLRAALAWRTYLGPPKEELRLLLAALNTDGWSGRLMYTKRPGVWAPDIDFSPFCVERHVRSELEEEAEVWHASEPIQAGQPEELKQLWRAASYASNSGAGVPFASHGDRFHAAALAAMAEKERRQSAAAASAGAAAPPGRATRPRLPIPAACDGAYGGHCGRRWSAPGAEARSPSFDAGYDATPISRALSMGRFASSPSHGEFRQLSGSPAHFFEQSPMAGRSMTATYTY